MENNLTNQHLNHLTESGFTVEQAEAIVRAIEQRSVNKKDLELLKKDLKLWTLGVVITGFVLFAGFISYLDSKTSARLDNMEADIKNIEADIKTLLLLNSPNSHTRNIKDKNKSADIKK